MKKIILISLILFGLFFGFTKVFALEITPAPYFLNSYRSVSIDCDTENNITGYDELVGGDYQECIDTPEDCYPYAVYENACSSVAVNLFQIGQGGTGTFSFPEGKEGFGEPPFTVIFIEVDNDAWDYATACQAGTITQCRNSTSSFIGETNFEVLPMTFVPITDSFATGIISYVQAFLGSGMFPFIAMIIGIPLAFVVINRVTGLIPKDKK